MSLPRCKSCRFDKLQNTHGVRENNVGILKIYKIGHVSEDVAARLCHSIGVQSEAGDVYQTTEEIRLNGSCRAHPCTWSARSA